MYQCRMSELTDYTCMVDDDVQNLTGSRVLEVAHGDAIVLSPYVPHRSVANRTAAGGSRSDGADPIGQTRWSVDLRVAPVAAGRSAAG
jgi:hypothetical protein